MDPDPHGVVPSPRLHLRGVRFDRLGAHDDLNDDAAPDGYHCVGSASRRNAANDRPAGTGFAPEAFEDVYAPDVFGIQLLGPGYAGRVPEHPRWETEPVGTASVLLKHADPAAWYAAPPITPPADDRWDPTQPPPTPPPLLTQSRSLMASILYTPGVLSRDGYANGPL
jgi:hypothetical protein